MTEQKQTVTAGVDTHKNTHTAAALDARGSLLGVREFPSSTAGYKKLRSWLETHGDIDRIGIEGTGSYGSGLARYLRENAIRVIEVNRPNRQFRRRRGKSDPADAEAAARATLSGDAVGTPKAQNGSVEVIRLLRNERRSAMKSRTQTANQIHSVLSTAPEPLRERFRGSTLGAIVKTAASFRVAVDATSSLSGTVRYVLRGLARRWRALNDEIRSLDKVIEKHVRSFASSLLEHPGIGVEVASALLVAAGDNPERLGSEASFAALCGASPVDASSGLQRRHRLNRAGNRDANRALWVVASWRMRCETRTQKYAAERTRQGLSRKEILRCLKRYIAREVFSVLRSLDLGTQGREPHERAA